MSTASPSPSRYAPSPLIDSAAGRGLALYRGLALVYAAAIIVLNRQHVLRPWLLAVMFGALVLWSLVAPWLRRPALWAILVETGLAVTGIFATNLVYTPASVTAGVPTVPGIWSASAVLAAALYAGVRGGLAVAALLGTCNIIQTQHETAITYHNIVLMLLLGSLVGLAVNLARESQVRLEAALAASERLAERERLARVVHDGVLQALAYINRRGRELGDEGVELASLAAGQEQALRTLITRIEPGGGPGDGTRTDLALLLAARRGERVEVVLPAGEHPLPTEVAREIDAAVGAALDNVTQHAGPEARAWVLLDHDGAEVTVTVRDNGVGLDPSRLTEAAGQGRLGVSSSIRGRLQDLGGEATWHSSPGRGCTVTLRLPAGAAAAGPGAAVGGSRP